jgi:hypothetical protein
MKSLVLSYSLIGVKQNKHILNVMTKSKENKIKLIMH